MTEERNRQLSFCKVCSNRAYDIKNGVFCGLEGNSSDFKNNCDYFLLDKNEKNRLLETKLKFYSAEMYSGSTLDKYFKRRTVKYQFTHKDQRIDANYHSTHLPDKLIVCNSVTLKQLIVIAVFGSLGLSIVGMISSKDFNMLLLSLVPIGFIISIIYYYRPKIFALDYFKIPRIIANDQGIKIHRHQKIYWSDVLLISIRIEIYHRSSITKLSIARISTTEEVVYRIDSLALSSNQLLMLLKLLKEEYDKQNAA